MPQMANRTIENRSGRSEPHNREETSPGDIRVPAAELSFSFARSSGPGGQNVNKVNTKAVLKWDYLRSQALSLEQKGALTRSDEFKGRINSEGEIIIQCSKTRSQGQNKEIAVERLHKLICQALEPTTERVPTKVPGGAKAARRRDKAHAKARKESRRTQDDADY